MPRLFRTEWNEVPCAPMWTHISKFAGSAKYNETVRAVAIRDFAKAMPGGSATVVVVRLGRFEIFDWGTDRMQQLKTEEVPSKSLGVLRDCLGFLA